MWHAPTESQPGAWPRFETARSAAMLGFPRLRAVGTPWTTARHSRTAEAIIEASNARPWPLSEQGCTAMADIEPGTCRGVRNRRLLTLLFCFALGRPRLTTPHFHHACRISCLLLTDDDSIPATRHGEERQDRFRGKGEARGANPHARHTRLD